MRVIGTLLIVASIAAVAWNEAIIWRIKRKIRQLRADRMEGR